jgi:ABC-type uncharacterized transport system substrate-binding protein
VSYSRQGGKFSSPLLISLALFLGLQATALSEEIGVLYNNKIPIYKKIAEKFMSHAKENGHNVKEVAYVKGKGSGEAMVANINGAGVTYMFCIGAPASKAANDSGTPGVFTMVVDPVKSGLTDKDGLPIGSLTGVLVNVSAEAQFKRIGQFMGKANKAGVVYDPTISAFVVNEYIKSSTKYKFEVFEVPVTESSDVPPAIEKLKNERNIDFLLSVVDNTVYNSKNIQVILRFSIVNKIPLIGFSPQQVKAGALVGFYCDYPMLGTQGAEVMENVVTSGGDVSLIPVEMPDEVQYSVNMKTAKIMKIKFPAKFKTGAKNKYE